MNATQFWQWGASKGQVSNFDESEVNQGDIKKYLFLCSYSYLNAFTVDVFKNMNPNNRYHRSNEEIHMYQTTDVDSDVVSQYAHFSIIPRNLGANPNLRMIVTDFYSNEKIIYQGSLLGPDDDHLYLTFISHNSPFDGDVYVAPIDQMVYRKAQLISYSSFYYFLLGLKIFDSSTNKLLFNYKLNVFYSIMY